MKKLAGLLGRWRDRTAEELNAAAVRLVTDAKAAARLRAYQTDPNVAALSIERTRDRLDRWGWLFMLAGLGFTTTNVQAFVAMGAVAFTLPWIAAWLVEPMVMGLMLVLLRGEQIANRHGEQAHGWVRWTRWIALLITYVMNTAEAWKVHDPLLVFIHSVPVLLVFLAAEALVQQRLTLTVVVDKLGDAPAAPSPQRRRSTPETVETGAEKPQETVEEPQAPEDTTDELSGSRTKKEQAYEAFRELVGEGRPLDEIGPAEVDRRAGIRVGSSKVPGRMDGFRERYLAEQAEVSDAAVV